MSGGQTPDIRQGTKVDFSLPDKLKAQSLCGVR